jgi:hypothetical protein
LFEDFGYSNQEVINMVRARQLLSCPEACPSAVYSLMVECWHEQAVRRPTFAEIGHRLKVWYQSSKRRELEFVISSKQLMNLAFSGEQMEQCAGSMTRKTSTTGSTISVRSFK